MRASADDSNRADLRALLEADARIPARLVEKLMSSADREGQADAYYCLSERWVQIQPELELWTTAPFVLGFLFRSITDPSASADLDSHAPSAFEAARQLLAILRARLVHPQGEPIVADLIERIDRTFLAGDETVRDCIETGFLEHALEYPELRQLFAHWAHHPEMREAHFRALEWGHADEHTQKRNPRNRSAG